MFSLFPGTDCSVLFFAEEFSFSCRLVTEVMFDDLIFLLPA